jgi:hypothetical protein
MDYEKAQRLKRARRAALREAGAKARAGQIFKNKARYSRKTKHKVDYS